MDIVLEAQGKINLTLEVIAKRPDGYHELSTVMQSVTLADTLTLRPAAAAITLETDNPGLPTDSRNLIVRAAYALRERTGVWAGAHIHLHKRIPLAAGMAGGSADAAATLAGLNQLWDLHLSQPELAEIALTLGSDVPFCLRGGTVYAAGRGEILTPLPPLPAWPVLLVTPRFPVATAEVYRRLDLAGLTPAPAAAVRAVVSQGTIEALSPYMVNALETVTERDYPVIGALKARLRELGAAVSLMSGSGPTVFGLFARTEAAEAAYRDLQDSPSSVHLAFLAPAGIVFPAEPGSIKY